MTNMSNDVRSIAFDMIKINRNATSVVPKEFRHGEQDLRRYFTYLFSRPSMCPNT
jgi:hypothetical protein